ncbi:sulfite exporter TauE/SafE family protein [Natribacillus halophilus]|uniref:Probable membrane transporter protein n=1 Tax=Natribacillus halophilus TaxID=549003 RepID=A0A1G8PHN3_9BACI|nr:sulfite exporter TauE/SafE family protein [Natribacillus halophilus]SDI92021.1 hypothetical protein SAMN04488123_108151 [Natribacillus halophilus]
MFWELLLVFVIVMIGAFVQGASGFGLGLVAMGFLPLILTIQESTLLVLSFIAATALTILVRHYKYINFKGLLVFIAVSFIGRIGSFFVLSTYGEMAFMQTWLGYFLIALVVYLYFSTKRDLNVKKSHHLLPIVLGLLNGFFGGLFAVGGTFLVVYCLLLYKDDKHRYTANVQIVTVITCLFSLLLHGINGDFEPSFPLYFLAGIFAVIIGAQLGMRWFEKLPTHLIRMIAMALVLIAALNLILFS